jgi:hypothetical protein
MQYTRITAFLSKNCTIRRKNMGRTYSFYVKAVGTQNKHWVLKGVILLYHERNRVGAKILTFLQTSRRNIFGGGPDLQPLQNIKYRIVCGSGGSWDFLMVGLRLALVYD